MFTEIPLNIPDGTKFYAAIGPYRAFGSTPNYICKECDSYDEAWDYIDKNAIDEDGQSVFIKGDFKGNLWSEYGYIEVKWSPEKQILCCHSFST